LKKEVCEGKDKGFARDTRKGHYAQPYLLGTFKRHNKQGLFYGQLVVALPLQKKRHHAHTKTHSCPFGANLLGTFKRNEKSWFLKGHLRSFYFFLRIGRATTSCAYKNQLFSNLLGTFKRYQQKILYPMLFVSLIFDFNKPLSFPSHTSLFKKYQEDLLREEYAQLSCA